MRASSGMIRYARSIARDLIRKIQKGDSELRRTKETEEILSSTAWKHRRFYYLRAALLAKSNYDIFTGEIKTWSINHPLPCRYNRDDIWLPILILASHEIRNEILLDLNNDGMVVIKNLKTSALQS